MRSISVMVTGTAQEYNPRVLVRLISGIFALFFLAQSAHAEEVTPWMFQGNMPKNYSVSDAAGIQVTEQGLSIANKNDWYILWPNKPIEGPVDVITIRAHADRTTKAALLWQPAGAKDGQLVQLYFTIEGGDGVRDTDVVVSGYPQWTWKTEELGLAFPAGSDVVIGEMQFRHWPFYERMSERWKSFWTFDAFRPYSINFLWGPLLSDNSAQRMQLFATLPPTAPSATRLFYIILIVAAVAAAFVARKQWRRERAFGIFIAVFALLWITFDVRMGAEILSYAVHDVQTYVLPAPKDKVLRNFSDIYARINAMLPFLKDQKSVAILAPVHEVYEPLMHYAIYPKKLITDPAAMSGATAWAVFDRNDMWVDDTGHLRQGNDPATATVLTEAGHIAEKTNDSSFLFLVP